MNQQFDCHYDGDWQKCDKEMCHREKQCRRRTSGTESAGGRKASLLTQRETQAQILAEFDERLWKTANDDVQLRMFSRYEAEAVRASLTTSSALSSARLTMRGITDFSGAKVVDWGSVPNMTEERTQQAERVSIIEECAKRAEECHRTAEGWGVIAEHIRALKGSSAAPAAALIAEDELAALRKDRALLNSMATLLAEARRERDELRKAIAASCDEDRAEILSRGHGGCPLLARSATPAKSTDDMTVQEFQGVLARANLLLQHKVLGDPSKGFTTPTCMCLSFPNACPVHRSPSDSSNNDR